MAFRYARFMMGSAVRRSALVFTVSEASRADILRFYPWADPEKVLVVPNAIDAELLRRPRPRGDGAGARALPDPRPLRPLRREREAAQEPGAAHPRLRPRPGAGGQRGPPPRADRGRRQPLRLAAAHGRGGGRAPGRALLRLRPPRHARRPLPDGVGLRLPLALRGLRPAPARGDGLRHAGRHLAHLLAAGGGRRRRPARRPVLRGGDRPGDRARPRRRGPATAARRARAPPRGRPSAGSARCGRSTRGT